MITLCLICNGPNSSLDITRENEELCLRFLTVASRFLHYSDSLTLLLEEDDPTQKLTVWRTLSLWKSDEWSLNKACCSECRKLVENFCHRYDQWQKLKLELKWMLKEISEKCPEKNGNNSEDVEQFRRKFQKLVNKGLKTGFPRINLKPKTVSVPDSRSGSRQQNQRKRKSPKPKTFTDAKPSEIHGRTTETEMASGRGRGDDQDENNSVEPMESVKKEIVNMPEVEPEDTFQDFGDDYLGDDFNESHDNEDYKGNNDGSENVSQSSKRLTRTRARKMNFAGTSPPEPGDDDYVPEANDDDEGDAENDKNGSDYERDDDDATDHTKGHRKTEKYSCKICGKQLNSKQTLMDHEFLHTGEKPFKCEECGKEFSNKSRYNYHLKIHTGERMFPCSECGRVFREKHSLKKHEKIKHSGVKPFSCSICTKSFAVETLLKRHVFLTHEGGARQKKVECKTCHRKFANKQVLRKHEMIHKNEKNFKCGVCGASFRTIGVLQYHEKSIHQIGEPFPHVCDVCGKRFQYPCILEHHKISHTGERPFLCQVCGKSFANEHSKRLHMKIHQERTDADKKYRCQFCNKGFDKTVELKRHEMIHTGERPFQCEFCVRRFITKGNMQLHQRNRHAKELEMQNLAILGNEETEQAESFKTPVPVVTTIDDSNDGPLPGPLETFGNACGIERDPLATDADQSFGVDAILKMERNPENWQSEFRPAQSYPS